MPRPLGKRTSKLLREAIVLAHVEGARWAGYHGPETGRPYPKDSEVVGKVLAASDSFRDLYPTLARTQEVQEARAQSHINSIATTLAIFDLARANTTHQENPATNVGVSEGTYNETGLIVGASETSEPREEQQ